MFIETEATSDPTRLRFLPGREVLAGRARDFRDAAEAVASPLAERLFAIPGVAGVALDRDSITVTRAGGDWQDLRPAILAAIMDHIVTGAPILRAAVSDSGQPAQAQGGQAERIREALRLVIDPELGFNIVDLGLVYEVNVAGDGKVGIVMTTTTPGCPATNYLKSGAGEAASGVEGVDFVEVTLTYDPRWTPEMMSQEAKDHFGIRDGGRW